MVAGWIMPWNHTEIFFGETGEKRSAPHPLVLDVNKANAIKQKLVNFNTCDSSGKCVREHIMIIR
jgi:hypothetical protein